jgi:murein tripeptide amidase MpaA
MEIPPMPILRPCACAAAAFLGLAWLVVAPAIAQNAPADRAEPYRGHALVAVDRVTPRQALAIAQVTDDIWTHSPRAGEPLEFRVTPEQLGRLRDLGIEHRIVIEDLQNAVNAERARIDAAGGAADQAWYEEYKTLAEHRQRAEEIVAASGGVAHFEIVGPSLEGREIYSVRIDDPAGAPGRPVILIIGGQHAREWVSPMTTTWLVELFAGSDPRAVALRRTFEYVIVPIMNPDGYQYTWDEARLWRKNRRDNGDGSFGVDLNRNWGHEWGGAGSSGQGGSDTYRGTGPFSEPELQSYTSYIEPFLDRAVAFFDIHSYGQLILSPWSYTTELPPEIDEYNRLGGLMRDAIASVHGASYTAGPGGSTLYLAAGASKDWGHVAAGAWAWTIELRPIGSPGFELPPAGIIPTAEEITEAMLQLGEDLSTAIRIAAADPVVIPGKPTEYGFEVIDVMSVVDPASVRVFTRAAGEPAFAEVAAEALGGSEYRAVLPATDCGGERQVYIRASSTTGEQAVFPAGAPAEVLSAQAWATEITLDDDVEIDLGWTVGAPGDTATAGIWELTNPQATSAQPGDDHTPDPGVLCWVTDGRSGGGAGAWDVDGGATTLTSYMFDASEPFDILNADALLTFWLWYSNDQGAAAGTDYLPVLISNNGGVDWVEMERLEASTSGWEQRSYRIGDHVTPTSEMQVRIVARDDEPGSLVEAAVDDIRLSFRGCPRHPADLNRDGVLDFFDFLAFQNLFAAMDPLADLDGDGEFTFFDFLEFQTLFAG